MAVGLNQSNIEITYDSGTLLRNLRAAKEGQYSSSKRFHCPMKTNISWKLSLVYTFSPQLYIDYAASLLKLTVAYAWITSECCH